jgi:predicted permease
MQLFVDSAAGEMFWAFGGSLITLVVCLLFGYIGRKVRIINDEADSTISILLVNIALPSLVLTSMLHNPFSFELLQNSLIVLAVMTVIFLAGYFLGVVFSKIMRISCGKKYIWQFSLAFPNVIYLGFPITQAVFGQEALIYTSMAAVVFNILVFTLGLQLIRASGDAKEQTENGCSKTKVRLKQVLLTPPLVAVYIGFLFFLTGFRPPLPILDGIGMIGNMTTPLAMLVVGSVLAKVRLFSLFTDLKVYPFVFLRLLAIPLLAFLALCSFIDEPIMLGTIVTMAAMPTAAITVIFAKKYKGDVDGAIKMVTLTNIFSLASIPIISLFLG